MIVLGVDPGTAITGYGVVQHDRNTASLLECGVIRTVPASPLHERLRAIHEGIAELIVRHKPDTLAVEDVFFSRNVRTTVVLGHARGVVLLAGARAGIMVVEYPPAEIKKAVVGTGAATKSQVQFMLTQHLRLKSAPEPTDAADGVAVALTYALSAHVESLKRSAKPALQQQPILRLAR
jgi:crossover junction endodeoxyribonuclease RuvC